jgi:hypothetical protein
LENDISVILGGSWPLLFTSFGRINTASVFLRVNIFEAADPKLYKADLVKRKLNAVGCQFPKSDLPPPLAPASKYLVTDICLTEDATLLFLTTILPEKILAYSLPQKKVLCLQNITDQYTENDYGTV